ncbi:hypothetical protein BGW36DRAFT_457519 [Talaromyces proteolyticus]|uniref:Uncharacterized protein n=1 Tax=Talaromyces proteolyticus TaxID=1131652 RepID=A0AAD4Q4F7_9EURO|nr:uncharacterized protein BGW36DRAFT_457519 [Talaromyces proteolyticus]KAH8703191.1 hypothetical protein BGW36DRAFT_457519 [Talaromyces proteolyticus]
MQIRMDTAPGPSATTPSPANKDGEGPPRMRWPTDPWEKDFRPSLANMSMEELRADIDYNFGSVVKVSDDDLRWAQSKEHAERLRPFYQWMALEKERGLEKEINNFPIGCKIAEYHDHVINILSQKAPDLVDRYKALARLNKGEDFSMKRRVKF